MGDTQAIIELLAADMRDEHAAIVQYLQHAYALGETGEASEIEAIAREEMRHFDWLAEAIVELGGDPDMERSSLDLAGEGPLDWTANDVLAEERAIAQYQEHISAIEDGRLVRLLERILSDERSHREQFASLSEELASEGVEAAGPLESRSADCAVAEDIDILQQGVGHEYSVILQYLYHNFVMPECEIGRELETQAINEMQHLGWLAEEVAERSGHPVIDRGPVSLKGSPQEMLQADIDAEVAVAAAYAEQIERLSETELRELVGRIREHEVYHGEVFSDLLAALEPDAHAAEEPSDDRPAAATVSDYTVGSLLQPVSE